MYCCRRCLKRPFSLTLWSACRDRAYVGCSATTEAHFFLFAVNTCGFVGTDLTWCFQKQSLIHLLLASHFITASEGSLSCTTSLTPCWMLKYKVTVLDIYATFLVCVSSFSAQPHLSACRQTQGTASSTSPTHQQSLSSVYPSHSCHNSSAADI